MNAVFVDTFYWVALTNPHDNWHHRVKEASQSLGPVRMLTTDEVLVEFLAFLSKEGRDLRKAAVTLVRRIRDNPNITVVPQSRVSFEAGLRLYSDRLDKQYSLTDCISMETMRQYGLTDVLTHDQHFSQEGFSILLKGD